MLRAALQRRAEAAGARAQRAQRRVRIFVRTTGSDALVGPIEVRGSDSVGHIEELIRQWIRDKLDEIGADEAMAGYRRVLTSLLGSGKGSTGRSLRLCVSGKPLPSTARLLSDETIDTSQLEVLNV